MSNQYLDTARQSAIQDTCNAIRAYLDNRNKNNHYASNIIAHVYEFFGGSLYEDGLSNYPDAAASALAAFTRKEVAEPLVASMGGYSYEFLVKLLSSTIELARWISANPSNSAEFDHHAYDSFDPGTDLQDIQRDLVKYQLMLKYDLEIEAADKELNRSHK
jgi:hypothetical protein